MEKATGEKEGRVQKKQGEDQNKVAAGMFKRFLGGKKEEVEVEHQMEISLPMDFQR